MVQWWIDADVEAGVGQRRSRRHDDILAAESHVSNGQTVLHSSELCTPRVNGLGSISSHEVILASVRDKDRPKKGPGGLYIEQGGFTRSECGS